MTITAFDPFISTVHPEEAVNIFEELGFERRHTKEGIEIAERDDTVIRMKDANGFYIDILQADTSLSHDTVGIRMNVDNFEDAYKMLLEKGFKNMYGDETVNTSSSKAAMMVSPSGFRIALIEHLK